MNPLPGLLEPVDQPVPVARRLHDDPHELIRKRLELLQDQPQIVRQPTLVDHLVLIVQHDDVRIVGVQIDTAI